MGAIVEITDQGLAYLPTAWEEALGEGLVKRFPAGKGRFFNAILKELRLGGIALVSGSWEEIVELIQALDARKDELLVPLERQGHGHKGKQFWEQARRAALERVVIMASPEGVLDTMPPMAIPHLLEFLGEVRQASGGLPLLIPALAAQSLLASLEERYVVWALDAELYAPQSVLQPRQQEVYDLMRERLLALRDEMPPQPVALDMGCGCGALALLLAQVLADHVPTVWATDILPEALATTRLNVAKLSEEGKVPPGAIHVSDGGDLFQPVAGQRFDLIAFNPPWANALPRTRLEVARFDYQQSTVRRFLESAPAYLKEHGHLLLFYADSAGPKAVETLQTHAAATGWCLIETISRRIRVAKRWEHIYLYDMILASL